MSFPKDPFEPQAPQCTCYSGGETRTASGLAADRLNCPIHGYERRFGHHRDDAPWWLIFVYIGLALLAARVIIGIASGQTQITPRQTRGLTSLAILKCSGMPPTPTTPLGCDGMYYVDVFTKDGQELKIIGTATSGAVIDPQYWSVIP
jgi:hypothetical protein